MARNPERRTALLDAAIDVLAAAGARGLTFRAVDQQAGVPVGTASNYFADREELLRQAGRYIFVRLAPDPGEVAERLASAPTRSLEVVLMQDIVRRAQRDRAGYLAMLELRLEATRRPELQASLTDYHRANLEEIVGHHTAGGFPGDRTTPVLLYLAMTGLIVEHLTLPEMLSTTTGALDDLVEDIVTSIVPER
ncbi:TetR family transcriptional regulator [Streptomyces sp. 549]|uniref:TetR/AcrR family transcriptional regulator n=1 Tax=Streptomyces sp. 549 TaxID=3049076 RepID=UPI0024C2EA0C|nr:TetR/AcrR family transcriptional regulator [Streptomyces sp. 549]MDK1473002.1 TetR family transcriptional regulator [Streptomyces sp. 549]